MSIVPKRFVYCYHYKPSRLATANVKEICRASGVLDREAKTIRLNRPHNHEPDVEMLSFLRIRSKILHETVRTPFTPLKEVYKNATYGEERAHLVGYDSIYR